MMAALDKTFTFNSLFCYFVLLCFQIMKQVSGVIQFYKNNLKANLKGTSVLNYL